MTRAEQQLLDAVLRQREHRRRVREVESRIPMCERRWTPDRTPIRLIVDGRMVDVTPEVDPADPWAHGWRTRTEPLEGNAYDEAVGEYCSRTLVAAHHQEYDGELIEELLPDDYWCDPCRGAMDVRQQLKLRAKSGGYASQVAQAAARVEAERC